jgi:DNA-directed RNA polymerase subunit D
MKVEILEKNDSKIKFLLSGVKASFAGALRRVMISEVPTMAIEWVDFKKNDSAMPDEVLANRLGQIPLTYDRKAYNLMSECKCESKGCSRCQAKISLKKKGPGIIYSEDLKSTDKSVQPAIEKIPIVELFENQELQFVATAQLGLGKEHAKWKGAVVGYKNLPKIKINDIDKKTFQKFVDVCPRDVFKIESDKLVVTNPVKCILCMQCVEASEKGEVEVEPVEDTFVFNVETASGIKPDEIVLLAAEIIGTKMGEFQKALKKIK